MVPGTLQVSSMCYWLLFAGILSSFWDSVALFSYYLNDMSIMSRALAVVTQLSSYNHDD